MRKKTVYNVSGVLDSKPTNLPEGLEVKEVEVDDTATLEVGAFHFADSGTKPNGVYIREDPDIFNGRHFTKEETRRIRDFLNKVLEEPQHVVRVIKDDVLDVWFEFSPNKWTQGNDYRDINPNPLQRARQLLEEGRPDGLVEQPLEEINRKYGPVTFIDNIWG